MLRATLIEVSGNQDQDVSGCHAGTTRSCGSLCKPLHGGNHFTQSACV